MRGSKPAGFSGVQVLANLETLGSNDRLANLPTSTRGPGSVAQSL